VQACREVVAHAFRRFHESDQDNLLWSCEGWARRSKLGRGLSSGHSGRRRRAHCALRPIHRRLGRVARQAEHMGPGRSARGKGHGAPLRSPAPSSGATLSPRRSPTRACLRPAEGDRSRADHAQDSASFRNRRGILRRQSREGRVVSSALEAMGFAGRDRFFRRR